MSLIENGDSVDVDGPVETHNPQPPVEAVPVAGIDLPAPTTAKQLRNQHLKVDEPKNKQFAARCTESEHKLIQDAMAANGCSDIVRLMLFSINLHKQDFLTPFKFQ